jgi:exodeoxyribonuclease V beta subunit
MEFTLPVGSEEGGSRLTPARLARVFAAHPSGAVPAGYAERLGALGFSALAGYLRGFVDLVFEHGGRFFVVDWKSNWLGPLVRDYAPERLTAAMADDHYFLQYHLYVTTLDRHLAARVPGYDYDTHFGGALYVFLRGFSRGPGGVSGVFADRPPRALVESLSRLLETPGAGEARP